MSVPRVSVLIASRDGERYLEAALASLAAQTFADFEVIAVDDGSRDRTGAILARFAASRPGTRVLRTEGAGLAGALHAAAGEARGEFLARHDDDDLSRPERFERQVAFLDAHPNVGVLGTAAEIIGEDGAKRGMHPVPESAAAIQRALRRAPPFVHGSVMMRAATYRAAGGYRAAFRASQDFDLWLRLPQGTGLANLAEPLFQWRHHPAGVFSRARDEQLRFAALARAFADERRLTGGDSIAAFERAGSFERFLDTWERGPELSLLLGEVFARDGRIVEARRHLARARRSPRTRGGALAWSLIAGAVAFTPRARRAAGEGAGA